jgi:hypothetical protein
VASVELIYKTWSEDPPTWECHHPGYVTECNFFQRAEKLQFGRSARAWRKPVLHIVAGTYGNVITDMPSVDGQDCPAFEAPDSAKKCSNHIVWACGYSVDEEQAQLVDQVPEGVEVCQPCAEKLAFLRKREDEQQQIDRSKYNAETKRLLEAAGVLPT